jgi:uncharacterized protein YwgA
VPSLNKVIACFREIGFEMDKEQYEHRLIAQKTVYLLKMKGIPFEYGFNLYVRGPYSPAFANEYYAHSDDIRNFNTTETLNDTEKEYSSQLLDLFGNKASLLEIGATYSYLVYSNHLSAVDAFRDVRNMKSFYSTEQIIRGINRAKQYLFVATDEDKRAIDPELKMWQRAGIQSMR